MSHSTQPHAAPSSSARGARAQRMAWFAAGALAAVVSSVAIGAALATPAPSVLPAVVSAATPAVSPSAAAPVPAPMPSLLLPSAGALTPQDDPGSNQQALRPLPSTSSGVTGDSNNRMIAVTGNDITGQSVLYLVDTIDKQLAVYQASGGSPGTQNVKLVGARNISLDLKLDGLNDRTEVDKQPLTYKDLERRFGNNSDRTAPSGAPR